VILDLVIIVLIYGIDLVDVIGWMINNVRLVCDISMVDSDTFLVSIYFLFLIIIDIHFISVSIPTDISGPINT